MKKIIIITDSASEMKTIDGEIIVCPLKILFGNVSYRDNVDISREEFYEKIRSEQPQTSLVSPYEIEEAIRPLIKKGYTVLGIFLSSKLSGTFQSATLAKTTIDSEDIHLIDSESVSLGLNLLVQKAQEYIRNGLDIYEIRKNIEDDKRKLKVFAAIDNVAYLKRGGRLSGTAFFMANVLSIKPVITIISGEIAVDSKQKGRKTSIKYLLEKVINSNIKDCVVVIAHANDLEESNKMKEYLYEKTLGRNIEIRICEIGPVVGTHSGPSCMGIAYFEDVNYE